MKKLVLAIVMLALICVGSGSSLFAASINLLPSSVMQRTEAILPYELVPNTLFVGSGVAGIDNKCPEYGGYQITYNLPNFEDINSVMLAVTIAHEKTTCAFLQYTVWTYTTSGQCTGLFAGNFSKNNNVGDVLTLDATYCVQETLRRYPDTRVDYILFNCTRLAFPPGSEGFAYIADNPTLTIEGTLAPVPEPGTILAALSILAPAAMMFKRRK